MDNLKAALACVQRDYNNHDRISHEDARCLYEVVTRCLSVLRSAETVAREANGSGEVVKLMTWCLTGEMPGGDEP